MLSVIHFLSSPQPLRFFILFIMGQSKAENLLISAKKMQNYSDFKNGLFLQQALLLCVISGADYLYLIQFLIVFS